MDTLDTTAPNPLRPKVTLTAFPAYKKVSVIKVVHDTTGLELGEAKTLIETLPATLQVPLVDAGKLMRELQALGATVHDDAMPVTEDVGMLIDQARAIMAVLGGYVTHAPELEATQISLALSAAEDLLKVASREVQS